MENYNEQKKKLEQKLMDAEQIRLFNQQNYEVFKQSNHAFKNFFPGNAKIFARQGSLARKKEKID